MEHLQVNHEGSESIKRSCSEPPLATTSHDSIHVQVCVSTVIHVAFKHVCVCVPPCMCACVCICS